MLDVEIYRPVGAHPGGDREGVGRGGRGRGAGRGGPGRRLPQPNGHPGRRPRRRVLHAEARVATAPSIAGRPPAARTSWTRRARRRTRPSPGTSRSRSRTRWPRSWRGWSGGSSVDGGREWGEHAVRGGIPDRRLSRRGSTRSPSGSLRRWDQGPRRGRAAHARRGRRGGGPRDPAA